MNGMDLKKGIPLRPWLPLSPSVEKAGDDGLSLPGACSGEELRPLFPGAVRHVTCVPLLN